MQLKITIVNYMHVRSSGDPVEITGERDSVTISCDFSGCMHATTHTLEIPMRNVQPRQDEFKFICRFFNCRDCVEEAGYLETEN
jgi:hypothetical protein